MLRETSLRWLAAIALPLMLVATILSVRPASAQAEPTSSLTWQVYTCPVGYTGSDYLTDCTPGAGGVDISLTDSNGDVQSGATDASGFVTFNGIPAGNGTSGLDVPGEFATFYFACFNSTSGSEVYLFDGTGNQSTLTFSGTTASDYSCRWYIIPENLSGQTPTPAATATAAAANGEAHFQVYACPVAYSGNDYLNDCSPMSDPVSVGLSAGDTYDPSTATTADTGADGRVAFTGLSAGDYTAYLDIPGEFATFYLACFDISSGSEDYLYDGTSNTTTFELGTNSAAISCRWYVIPENLSGQTPTVSATSVPATTVPATSVPATSVPATTVPTARPSASTGNVVNLPDTGSGPGTKGGMITLPMLIVIAALIVGIFGAVALRRNER